MEDVYPRNNTCDMKAEAGAGGKQRQPQCTLRRASGSLAGSTGASNAPQCLRLADVGNVGALIALPLSVSRPGAPGRR